jgi:hypothetical protein
MSIKAFFIALSISVTGTTGVLLTTSSRVALNEPEITESAETTPGTGMEIIAVDQMTNQVIAEYPSPFDAEVLTNIPECEVINSMFFQEPVEGVIFRPK